MLWIRLALRNTLRHPRRTLLTAGTVLAATALLTVLLAYLSGVIGGIVQDFTAAAGHVRLPVLRASSVQPVLAMRARR